MTVRLYADIRKWAGHRFIIDRLRVWRHGLDITCNWSTRFGLFSLLHTIVQSVDGNWMPDSAVTSVTNIIKQNSTQNSLPDFSMNLMQELSICIKLRFSFSTNIPYFLVYVHRAEHGCQIVSCLILHARDQWLHFRIQGHYFDWGFPELYLNYIRRKPKIIYYACIRQLHSTAGVGNLLAVLCRSNVAKSLSVPTHPSPPYFYIQQPLKHVNLILSKLSFRRDVKTGIVLKELYASI